MQENSNNTNRVLGHHDKLVDEASNILALLWRTILGDLRISTTFYQRLMLRYLSDPTNNINQNAKDRQTEQGNLKALFNNNMTANNFHKGLKLLRVIRINVTVEITRETDPDNPTTHSIQIDNPGALAVRRKSRRRKSKGDDDAQ